MNKQHKYVVVKILRIAASMCEKQGASYLDIRDVILGVRAIITWSSDFPDVPNAQDFDQEKPSES